MIKFAHLILPIIAYSLLSTHAIQLMTLKDETDSSNLGDKLKAGLETMEIDVTDF